MQKLISIIIPFYKLVFFEETLKSLANQTDKRFKVYIGDDASPEDCTPLFQKYENTFDFKYHRFETNLGSISLTKHWKRCIDLIDDNAIKWIMILGDDDVLSENVVEEFYRNIQDIEELNINVIRYASIVIDEVNNSKSDIYLHPKFEYANDFFIRRINGLTRSSLSEYVFSKRVYLKYEFNDYSLAWHSDEMAWLNFSESNYIFSINKSHVSIRYSEMSISGSSEVLNIKHKTSILFYDEVLKRRKELFGEDNNKIIIIKRKKNFVNASYGVYLVNNGEFAKGILKIIIYNNWFGQRNLKISQKKILKTILLFFKNYIQKFRSKKRNWF